MSIRLLLDARKIFDGGIGVYTQNIIEALVSSNQIQICLLINPDQKSKIYDYNFAWLNQVSWREDTAKVLTFDEYWNLARRVNFKDFDLYQSPFITLPKNLPIPGIITIHDLIQITHPEKFYYPLFAKIIIGNSIKLASGILTVSKSSQSLIQRYFSKITSGKLQVIPNALGSSFWKSIKVNSAQKDSAIKTKKFLMALYSNLKPHKGCLDLLTAFSSLVAEQKISKDLNLLLVGNGLADLSDPQILKVMAGCPQIINRGAVDDSELLVLLATAEALVVSSLVEGFSLPVLQAHSQGTPVIVRPIPAILELLAEGDIVAEDFSCQALKAAVLKFSEGNSEIKQQYDLSHYDLLSLSDKLLSYYKKILGNESSISA